MRKNVRSVFIAEWITINTDCHTVLYTKVNELIQEHTHCRCACTSCFSRATVVPRAATHEHCSTSVDLSATASEPGLEYGRPRRSCYALPLAMRCTAHPEHHCVIVKRPAASMRLNVRECVTSRHAFTSRKNGTQLIALRAD
jgi:hypothetical protein